MLAKIFIYLQNLFQGLVSLFKSSNVTVQKKG